MLRTASDCARNITGAANLKHFAILLKRRDEPVVATRTLIGTIAKPCELLLRPKW
jgi:hypothetical protein